MICSCRATALRRRSGSGCTHSTRRSSTRCASGKHKSPWPRGERPVSVPLAPMSTVHVKIDIDAPARRVWDIVMDPYQLEDWVTIHRSLSEVSSRRMTKGSTMGQTLHMRGVSFHVHWMLVDVKVPSHAEWVGR